MSANSHSRTVLSWLLLGLVATAACSDPAPTATLSKAVDAAADVDTAAISSDTDDSQDAPADSADTTGSCTVSAECPGDKDLCIAGICLAQTPCTTDKQCQAAGLVCDPVGGVCVQCLSSDDCAPTEQCKAHKCLPPPKTCASTKDCDLGMVCDKAAKACVECLIGDDCSKGLACSETVCVAMLCQPGTTSCADGKTVKTCTADGLGYDQADCLGDSVCVAGDCASAVCEPGKPVCVGAAVAVCNDTGTALGDPKNCDDTQVCENGQCVTPICKPGAVECQNSEVATCSDSGTNWTKNACENGKVCAGGQCVAKVCEPGLAFCDGGQPKQCDASGSSATALAACNSGQMCVGGQCVAASCKPGDTVCADTKTLATCKADGSGYSNSACPSGSACAGGQCKTQLCQANLAFCQGTQKAVCNATGTGSTVAEDCAKSGKLCSNGTCIVKACVPGTKQCSGASLQTCNPEGSQWLASSCEDTNPCTTDSCAASSCTHTNVTDGVLCADGVCKAGVCQPAQACVPGTKQCSGPDLQTCKGDGSGWDTLPCDDGNVCTQDSCNGTQCVHTAVPDSTPCNDLSACTANDACQAGVCQGDSQLWTLDLAAPTGDIKSVAQAKNGGWLVGGSRLVRISAAGKVLWDQKWPYGVQRVAATDAGWVALATSQNAVLFLDDAGKSPLGWSTFKVNTQFLDMVGFGAGGVLCGFDQQSGGPVISYVAKVDSSGQLTQQVPIEDGANWAQLIVRMPQGGFVVGSNGVFPSLTKLDDNLKPGNANGISGWPDTNSGGGLLAMAAEPDGSLVVGGSYIKKTGTPAYQAIIMRVTTSGSPIWTQKLDFLTQSQVVNLAPGYGGEVSAVIWGIFAGESNSVSQVSLSAQGGLLWRQALPLTYGYPTAIGTVGSTGTIVCGTLAAGALMHCRRADEFGTVNCSKSGTCFEKLVTDCDDGNACTNNSCASSTGCNYAPFADGTKCGLAGQCTSGVCGP